MAPPHPAPTRTRSPAGAPHLHHPKGLSRRAKAGALQQRVQPLVAGEGAVVLLLSGPGGPWVTVRKDLLQPAPALVVAVGEGRQPQPTAGTQRRAPGPKCGARVREEEDDERRALIRSTLSI